MSLEFDAIDIANKRRSTLGNNFKTGEMKSFGRELDLCINENNCEEIHQILGNIGRLFLELN